MKYWIQKFLAFFIAGVMYIIGEFFSNPQSFGYCQTRPDRNSLCLANTAINIGWPLIAAGEILALVGLILLFANQEGLRKWWWTSLVYVPLSALIVANTHQTGGWISFSPSPEHVTWLLGYGYLLLTFAIVAGTRYVARRPMNNHSKTMNL